MEENKGARLVTSAMLGLDGESVIIGGKGYFIKPPTIKKIVGCAHYLGSFGDEKSIGDFIRKLDNLGDICKGLSYLIKGDETLTDDLQNGTVDEIITAVELGIGLIGTRNFLRLSALSRNVNGLIAKR